jgi:hypothetical protein
MYSFKDFSTVQYAGGETEMQDFYAYKRKRSLAEEGTEKIRANFKQSRHPQLKVADNVKEAEAAKPVDEANDALDTRRQADIKKDHESLMGKSTDEVHKIHRDIQGKVQSKYTPAEVGGKKGMVADILRHRHGDTHVAKHFGLAEAKDPQTLSKIKARLKKKPMVKVSVTKPVGYRIADIGAGGVEHNVKTGTI